MRGANPRNVGQFSPKPRAEPCPVTAPAALDIRRWDDRPEGVPDDIAIAAMSNAPWESGVGWHYPASGVGWHSPADGNDDLDLTRVYPLEACHPTGKPRGLWVSWERCDRSGGWGEWCRENEHGLCGREPRVLIAVDASRLLHLADPADLPADAAEARCGERTCTADARRNRVCFACRAAVWRRVSEDWAGVSVDVHPVYQHLDTPHWWTAWDVRSACVWDLSAVRYCAKLPA